MSNEEKAKIARENGSKSHGPATEAGKAKSARNGIKTGEFAQKLAAFVPPDSAVLCNEDRQKYFNLYDQLIQIYAPINQESMNLVRQIAIARWQIERLHSAVSNVWNFALLRAAGEPTTVVEEMADAEAAARAVESLFSGATPVERMSRQIDRLEIRIARWQIERLHAATTNVWNFAVHRRRRAPGYRSPSRRRRSALLRPLRRRTHEPPDRPPRNPRRPPPSRNKRYPHQFFKHRQTH